MMLAAWRNPWPSPSKNTALNGTLVPRKASATICVWFGGTTLSSVPWNMMIGDVRRSRWWIGDRSRYTSAPSGYGATRLAV